MRWQNGIITKGLLNHYQQNETAPALCIGFTMEEHSLLIGEIFDFLYVNKSCFSAKFSIFKGLFLFSICPLQICAQKIPQKN